MELKRSVGSLVGLVLLCLVMAVPANAELFMSASATVFQFNSGQVLLLDHSATSCSSPGYSVFAECGLTVEYGHIAMFLEASGSGCDGCQTTYGAMNEATIGFADQITFYGPEGGSAAVAWGIQYGNGSTSGSVILPDFIEFNQPYTLSASMGGTEAAFGDISNWLSDEWALTGFQLFDPSCAVWEDTSLCGPAIDTTVSTSSGFLYGGRLHTTDETASVVANPEPSSLVLLLLAASACLGTCYCKARRRRIAAGTGAGLDRH